MEVNNNSNSSGKQEMWNEVLIGNTTWLNLQNVILGIRRWKNSHVCCIISCILNVLNHQIHRKQIYGYQGLKGGSNGEMAKSYTFSVIK